MEQRKKEKRNDNPPFTVYFWFRTCSFSNSAFIPLFICFICLCAPSVYKRHGVPSGSSVTFHRESFIMGWKSWGEGPAALRKPSERSSGWQHHLLGKTGKTEEGNKEEKQHESLIIQHKHKQWNSKKIGNVPLNWTLNPHLDRFPFLLQIPLFLRSQTC